MIDHKHSWKRLQRIHKKPPRFFVLCTICKITRQAVINFGKLHVFHTGSEKGGKSITVHARLKRDEYQEMKFFGIKPAIAIRKAIADAKK